MSVLTCSCRLGSSKLLHHHVRYLHQPTNIYSINMYQLFSVQVVYTNKTAVKSEIIYATVYMSNCVKLLQPKHLRIPVVCGQGSGIKGHGGGISRLVTISLVFRPSSGKQHLQTGSNRIKQVLFITFPDLR